MSFSPFLEDDDEDLSGRSETTLEPALTPESSLSAGSSPLSSGVLSADAALLDEVTTVALPAGVAAAAGTTLLAGVVVLVATGARESTST